MLEAKEIILTLLFIFIILYQSVINFLNRRDHKKREDDLIDRFYSKDFPEFVEGKKRLERKPDKPVTSKERMTGVEAAVKADADILEMG